MIRSLHAFMAPMQRPEDPPVLVTTLDQINLAQGSVLGTIVSEDSPRPEETALPALIYNFSFPSSRGEFKKLQALAEIDGVTVMNDAYLFSRKDAFKMLLSHPETKEFLLPHPTFGQTVPPLPQDGSLLMLPERTLSLSGILYAECGAEDCFVYGINGVERLSREECEALFRRLPIRRRILLPTPTLAAGIQGLFIGRVYLMLNYDGSFQVLRTRTFRPPDQGEKTLRAACAETALSVMPEIHGFLPELAVCFADFVCGVNSQPYFIGFGGWDGLLPGRPGNRAGAALCAGIMEYAAAFFSSEAEG